MSLELADAKLAEKPGLVPEAGVMITRGIFLADRLPVIFCKDPIPGGPVRSACTEAELQASAPIYAFLEDRCGQRVDFDIPHLEPVVADTRLAEHSGCPMVAPALYLEEVGSDSIGTPLVYSEESYPRRISTSRLPE